MSKWIFLFTPERAKQRNLSYETEPLSNTVFILGAIITRVLFMYVFHHKFEVSFFFVSAISVTATASIATWILYAIIVKSIGKTQSEISSVIWFLQFCSGLILVAFCLLRATKAVLIIIVCAVTAFFLLRFLWRYYGLSIERSVLSSLFYFIIALYLMIFL